ncbi:MAG: hypothetical protein DRJ47_08970 [Thermoprotei archaeon]|nr:MAG: hypothetical protein DRJ47_08970 [Thermoprotei archaeon]
MKKLIENISVRFWLVSAIVAMSTLGDALLYALLPADPGSFGVKVWQVGILLGANRFVRLVTNEIAGRLSKRHENKIDRQNKKLFIVSIAGGLITAGYVVQWGFLWLLFLRLSWGACWSLLRLEGYISALSTSSPNTRGRIFGFYQSLIRLGQGGGVFLGGIVADIWNIPTAFIVFSLLTISIGFFSLSPPAYHFSSPPDNTDNTDSEDKDSMKFLTSRVCEEPTPGRVRRHDSTKSFLLVLGIFTFALACTEQMAANLTGRLVSLRISGFHIGAMGAASITGFLLSFRAFVIVPLGPLVGAVMDKYGRMGVIRTVILSQLAAITGLTMFQSWYSTVVLMIIQLATGITGRYIVNVVAADLAPDKNASLHVSRFTTFLDLGTATGPIIGFAAFASYEMTSIAVLAWIFLLTAMGMTVYLRNTLP